MVTVYISWTISMERSVHAVENDYNNESASIATIFWIFMYAPAYNIGYNALTYSKSSLFSVSSLFPAAPKPRSKMSAMHPFYNFPLSSPLSPRCLRKQ